MYYENISCEEVYCPESLEDFLRYECQMSYSEIDEYLDELLNM